MRWLLVGPVAEPPTVPGGPPRSAAHSWLPVSSQDALLDSPDTCAWPPSHATFSSHADLLGSSQTQASKDCGGADTQEAGRGPGP